MSTSGMTLVEEPDRLRAALPPLRRRLLDRLRSPASATQLAAELELPRQRLNYHLRILEQAGLVELVEERKRRGCTERILRATAEAFVVDPNVMSAALTKVEDRYAVEHLVGVAADTVRQVTRMQTAAERSDTRLLTFTIEADIRFAHPGDVHRFTDALAEALTRTAAEFDHPGGRSYRVVVGGHPTPRKSKGD